ncbi:hypothetical protein K456DRAFT_1380949 [Colletotrichum gloeosporioides 23]|nr:hypothetical protein K456DRAFT_1380949 [Colletotrichum gloeosporioides 23]
MTVTTDSNGLSRNGKWDTLQCSQVPPIPDPTYPPLPSPPLTVSTSRSLIRNNSHLAPSQLRQRPTVRCSDEEGKDIVIKAPAANLTYATLTPTVQTNRNHSFASEPSATGRRCLLSPTGRKPSRGRHELKSCSLQTIQTKHHPLETY